MKEVTLYECEVCGSQYSSSKMAKECEKIHKTIQEIGSVKYRSMDGYPNEITVVFSGNKRVTYHR